MRTPLGKTAVAGLIGSVLLVMVIGSVVRSGLPRAAEGTSCNGHAELCPRRLDEVVFAATHNSMSSSADNFASPNQAMDMADQLDAGYRGLLVDTYYHRRNGELDLPLREPGVFLCHMSCDSGALPAVAALREVRRWLEDNPRDVIVIFVEDATSATDTAAAFGRSGLSGHAYAHEWGTPLPTLDEMIAANKRLFVMAEHDSGGVDWYHDGFKYTQETPFRFETAADFSCQPNRGTEASPLFQVNHFITPARSANASINDLDVLLPRLEQCQAERGRLPNLVVVDYGEAGNVLVAVDALNGFPAI